MRRIKYLSLILLAQLLLMSVAAQNFNRDSSRQLYLANIAAAEAFIQLNKISAATKFLEACDPNQRGLEWQFLKAHLDQSSAVFREKGVKEFNAIKFHPSGKFFAAVSSDSAVMLLSYPEKKLIKKLHGHNSIVNAVDFSSDGKKMATGGRNGLIIIWDVATGNILSKNATAFSQGIYKLRFNRADNLLGAVSWELRPNEMPIVMGLLKVLDATTATELNKIETEPHPAAGLVYTTDNKNVIVNTWGQIIFSYKLETGAVNWKYDLSDNAEYNSFHSMDISPDGKTIAVGSTDHRIYLLNIETGQLIRKIEPWEGHTGTVKAVQFSPDGKFLASGGEDQLIIVFSTADYKKEKLLTGHTHTVSSLVWDEAGKNLLSTSLDGTIREWNMAEPFMQAYDICDFGPWQTPFTPDKKYFAAPCSDSSLAWYEVATGKAVHHLGKQSGLAADISNDAKWLVTASFDGVVRLWDVKSGKQVKTFNGHTSRVDGVAILPDNRIVSVGDTTMRVWTIDKKDVIIKKTFKTAPFRVVTSPDGKRLYTSFSGGWIRIISTPDLSEIDSMKCESGIQEIAISADGRRLAAFAGKNIEVWDLELRQRLWKLEGHEQAGYGIGFSPGGQYLVSGSYDQTFKLWDVDRGECTLTYHGYQDIIYNCKILSDHELFISASQGIIRYYKF